ncbi:MAG: SpoIIE family protein phosphatase, partial [Phascolarctobacterium sp.]|nr:SpoIIE family protein phosphatase [Phascolarctobacterium sp.]
LIKKLIVNNIERINDSLTKITDGDLNEVVDVRSHVEFASLSDDINSTVGTLKKYIADAAARIDAELAFAKAIQHSALPSVFPPFPTRKEFDIWATMDTAKEVGGDFYDFYFVNKDTLAFLIADVSGKGIPAAMFMMNAKAVLKSYAESGLDVNKVFTLGNEKLCEGNDAGMFVTAWMGFLNTETGEVTFANAGHNPPLVRHADGSFEYLKARAGFVLAGMEGVKYRKNELQLAPGDVIYLYTDGVTEATNINDELYGEDRLLALLNANKEASMEKLCKLVKEDVFAFAGEAPQFDDITMLALKYCGATAPTNQEEAL